MKVIFLDVDGVLNSQAHFHAEYERKQHATSGCHADAIDPLAVRVLNQVVERTGAKIVFSSTWRRAPRFFAELLPMFREKGMMGDVIGRTPSLPHPNVRGDEIYCYMSTMLEWPQFVILDDSNDMGDLTPWLVRTDGAFGLCFNQVDQVVEMLHRPGWNGR